MRLLDVGCGWGGMVMHAAEHYGVRAVGITLSQQQAELARERVRRGRPGRTGWRSACRTTATSTTARSTPSAQHRHVRARRHGPLRRVLHQAARPAARPGAGCSTTASPARPGRRRIDRNSFIARYVFPDGGLHEVGTVVSAMQEEGFEVRDVESLREHYALTLRAWVANLEAHWDEARRAGRAAPGPDLAPVHGGVCAQLRGRAHDIHQVLAVGSAATAPAASRSGERSG